MESWVDLGSLIAARPGVEPTAALSQVRRPNRYATKPPLHGAFFSDTKRQVRWKSDAVSAFQPFPVERRLHAVVKG